MVRTDRSRALAASHARSSQLQAGLGERCASEHPTEELMAVPGASRCKDGMLLPLTQPACPPITSLTARSIRFTLRRSPERHSAHSCHGRKTPHSRQALVVGAVAAKKRDESISRQNVVSFQRLAPYPATRAPQFCVEGLSPLRGDRGVRSEKTIR